MSQRICWAITLSILTLSSYVWSADEGDQVSTTEDNALHGTNTTTDGGDTGGTDTGNVPGGEGAPSTDPTPVQTNKKYTAETSVLEIHEISDTTLNARLRGVYANQAALIKQIAKEKMIDPVYLVAYIAHETGWGASSRLRARVTKVIKEPNREIHQPDPALIEKSIRDYADAVKRVAGNQSSPSVAAVTNRLIRVALPMARGRVEKVPLFSNTKVILAIMNSL